VGQRKGQAQGDIILSSRDVRWDGAEWIVDNMRDRMRGMVEGEREDWAWLMFLTDSMRMEQDEKDRMDGAR